MRRRNNILKILIVAGAASMLAPFVFAQQAVKPPSTPQAQVDTPDSGEAVFSSETRLVPLNITVTDKSRPPGRQSAAERFSGLRKRRPAADQAVPPRGRSRLHGTDHR